MTDSEIRKLCEEVEEYCSKATPGPWTPERVYDDEPERNGYEWEVLHHKTNPPCCSESIQDGCGMLREAEARFIARARTDLPKLLSLLRSKLEGEQEIRELLIDIAAFADCQCDNERDKQTGDLYQPCVVCRAKSLLPSIPDCEGRRLTNVTPGAIEWLEKTQGIPDARIPYSLHTYSSLLAAYSASLLSQLSECQREGEEARAMIPHQGDGACDHCGRVPSVDIPTRLCDECRDGVKRAEAAEQQLQQMKEAIKLIHGRKHNIPWNMVSDTVVEEYVSELAALRSKEEK